MSAMVSRDAGAVVSHNDANTALPAVLPIPCRVSVDPYSAAFTNRLHRIHHQVGKDLSQLAGIPHHDGIRIVFSFQADAGFVATMLVEFEDTVEHRRELDRNRTLGLAIEPQRLFHDVADPLELVFGDVEV